MLKFAKRQEQVGRYFRERRGNSSVSAVLDGGMVSEGSAAIKRTLHRTGTVPEQGHFRRCYEGDT